MIARGFASCCSFKGFKPTGSRLAPTAQHGYAYFSNPTTDIQLLMG
ncbi:MAG: hypothetical protein ACK4GN_09570 [Runella sp.]